MCVGSGVRACDAPLTGLNEATGGRREALAYLVEDENVHVASLESAPGSRLKRS